MRVPFTDLAGPPGGGRGRGGGVWGGWPGGVLWPGGGGGGGGGLGGAVLGRGFFGQVEHVHLRAVGSGLGFELFEVFLCGFEGGGGQAGEFGHGDAVAFFGRAGLDVV